MKKLILFAAVLFGITSVGFGSDDITYLMRVKLKSGEIKDIPVNDIEEISWTDESYEPVNPVPVQQYLEMVTAEIYSNNSTRAAIVSNNIYWKSTDTIYVFSVGAVPYVISGGEGDVYGKFLPVDSARKMPYEESFRYSGFHGFRFGKENIVWPTEYVCDNADDLPIHLYAQPAFLELWNPILVFRPCGGVLSLDVSGEGDIAQVKITADKRLGGKISLKGDGFVIDDNGPNTMRICFVNPISLSQSQSELNISLPSGEYKSFTIELLDSYGHSYKKSTSKVFSLNDGYLYKISFDSIVFE